MIKVTVSGSFHRHMQAIYEAVGDLRATGVDVLSPSDPRVVDAIGDFLFVASDRLRSIELVQRRHFEAIRSSDFLWLVAPDGYTGESTSGEIGAAAVLGVPVFAEAPVLNTTWQAFVRVVPSISDAIRMASRRARRTEPFANLQLDPFAAASAITAAVESSADIFGGRAHLSGVDARERLTASAAVISAGARSISP